MLLSQSIRLISIWLFPVLAFANIGEVSELSGVAAQIEREGTELTADLATNIESMDEVETTNGRLKIAFVDETEVSLTEHTYLEINEYVYDPDPAKSRMALNFAQGTARFATGKLGLVPRENISIQTPTATIGIRGTDFTTTVDELGRSLVILLPNGDCLDARNLEAGCVPSGSITVSNMGGSVTLEEAYQAVLVTTSETRPTQPVVLENITVAQIDNMFIVSEPDEVVEQEQSENQSNDMLDFDGLDKDFLEEDLFQLEDEPSLEFTELDINYLDVDLLATIMDDLDDLDIGITLGAEVLNDKQAATNITGTLNPGFDPQTGYNTVVESDYVWFYRENNGKISLRVDPSATYLIVTQPDGTASRICVNACGGSEIIIRQTGG